MEQDVQAGAVSCVSARRADSWWARGGTSCSVAAVTVDLALCLPFLSDVNTSYMWATWHNHGGGINEGEGVWISTPRWFVSFADYGGAGEGGSAAAAAVPVPRPVARGLADRRQVEQLQLLSLCLHTCFNNDTRFLYKELHTSTVQGIWVWVLVIA